MDELYDDFEDIIDQRADEIMDVMGDAAEDIADNDMDMIANITDDAVDNTEIEDAEDDSYLFDEDPEYDDNYDPDDAVDSISDDTDVTLW